LAFEIWELEYKEFAAVEVKEDGRWTFRNSLKDRVCEGCVYGKMHRFPFPKTSWRARSPLELVHADICGPAQCPSLGDKQYFILYVDDFTRMILVYFLDSKSNAFNTFLHFKALVEKQSGCLIKTI